MNSLEAHIIQQLELFEEQVMSDPFIVLLMETTELDLFMDLDSSDRFNLFIILYFLKYEYSKYCNLNYVNQ